MERPLRILILEDDQVIRHLIANMLATSSTERPLDVDRASSLAVGRFKIDAQTPDVLLLDLNLEDSRSEQTLMAIPNLAKAMAVIVISSSETDDTIKRAMSYGAQDFIEKGRLGENKAHLWERIERAYQRFCADREEERMEIKEILRGIRRNIETLKRS